MLEIIFLIWFCKKLAGMARAKNRSGGWGALGAVMWVGGEVGGFVVGAGHAHGDTGTAYLYAILSAVAGAIVAFIIVKSLSEIPLDTNFPSARVV